MSESIRLVCAVDLGSTAIKAGVLDSELNLISQGRVDAPALSDWHGFASFDADAYMRAAVDAIGEAVKGAEGAGAVGAIAVTGQRGTIVPVDSDRKVLAPALSWQDTSVASTVEAVAESFGSERFTRLTGVPPFFALSVFKIIRLREAAPAVAAKVAHYLTLSDYLLLLLGADEPASDPCTQSTSGLADIRQLSFDPELLKVAHVSREQLPKIVPTGASVGKAVSDVARGAGLPAPADLIPAGGDQQCAALGAGARSAGEASLCLGTIGAISCVGREPLTGLPGTFCVAHVTGNEWIVEGMQNACGSALDWVASLLATDAAGLDALAASSSPGAKGVRFVPYLAGTGTPSFDANATGAFEGLKATHGRCDIARAAVEGVCGELKSILDIVRQSLAVNAIYVSGGALSGSCGREVLRETLGMELRVLDGADAGLRGAAIQALEAAT